MNKEEADYLNGVFTPEELPAFKPAFKPAKKPVEVFDDEYLLAEEITKLPPTTNLDTYYCVDFLEVVTATQRGFPKSGAILLKIEVTEGAIPLFWFPKKLCVNISLETRTIFIWEGIIHTKNNEGVFNTWVTKPYRVKTKEATNGDTRK